MPQIMDDDAIKQIAVCRMCLRSKDVPAAAQNRFAQNSSNDADDLIIRTEDEDDGHLLTQNLVEKQQPVQTTVRDSNDDQVQISMTSAYAKICGSR
ncbi:unnamed protein product [Caenorhabditis nigoni]